MPHVRERASATTATVCLDVEAAQRLGRRRKVLDTPWSLARREGIEEQLMAMLNDTGTAGGR
jgi:hypothetical protein